MLHAMQVLELDGGPEACQVLETLTPGMAEHRVTVAAQEALLRLKMRQVP